MVGSASIKASPPTMICYQGVKPVCHEVGGGTFSAALPVDNRLVCNATAAGTVQYADVASGLSVTKPVTFVGRASNPQPQRCQSHRRWTRAGQRHRAPSR